MTIQFKHYSAGGGGVGFAIVPILENVTGSASNPTTIQQGGTATLVFTANSGYGLPDSVTVTGVTGNWTKATGTLVLTNPTANVVFTIAGVEELTELCFTANTGGSTVELVKVGSPSIANTAYSRDRVTWTTFTPSTTAGTNTITLANAGDKVYFRNDMTEVGEHNYLKFVMSGSISADGNCNSLISATNFNSIDTISQSFCFWQLFRNCTSLTTPPKLPATTLTGGDCYHDLFNGCVNLTEAPELPATTICCQCYYTMFAGCTSLTQAPALPATSMAFSCYFGMFRGCTSLTQAPELPATTLFKLCYRDMFVDCTSLILPPSIIPANEMAEECCSHMFYGCIALLKTPNLPATIMAQKCYYNMFLRCSALVTITNLPATTLATDCYGGMFAFCSSLVFDASQTTGAPYLFRLPSSGVFSNTTNQPDMFSHSSSSLCNLYAAAGSSNSYYTKNNPF